MVLRVIGHPVFSDECPSSIPEHVFRVCFYHMAYIVSWMLLFFSVFFAVLAVREFVIVIRLLKRGARAVGVVTRLADDYDEGTPIIEYKTDANEQRTLRLTTRFWGEAFSVGQKVPLLYDQKKGECAIVDRTMHHWAGPVAWALLSISALIARWMVPFLFAPWA